MFNGKDVEGCNIVRVFHVIDGGNEGKKLDGLTVIIVPHPDDLKTKESSLRKDGKPVDQAIYVDDGISTAQESALISKLAENLMSAGWNNSVRRRAAIRFTKLTDGYDIEAGKSLHLVTHFLKGANGQGGDRRQPQPRRRKQVDNRPVLAP